MKKINRHNGVPAAMQAEQIFRSAPSADLDPEVRAELEQKYGGVEKFRKVRLEASRNWQAVYPTRVTVGPQAAAQPAAPAAEPSAPAYVPATLDERMWHELQTNPRAISPDVAAYMNVNLGEQAARTMRLRAVEQFDRSSRVTVRVIDDATHVTAGGGTHVGRDAPRSKVMDFDSVSGKRR